MKVIINETIFENAGWSVDNGIGNLEIKTNDSLAEILSKIGDNNNILVYDNEDVLLSTWYNSGIKGAAYKGSYENVKEIEISFIVSILNENTKKQLQDGVEDNVEAIIELARMASDFDENIEKNKIDIKSAKNDIESLKNDVNTVKTQVEGVDKMQTNISSIQETVNMLQNKMNNIPKDIVERFTELWTKYNALADRVAVLENK